MNRSIKAANAIKAGNTNNNEYVTTNPFLHYRASRYRPAFMRRTVAQHSKTMLNTTNSCLLWHGHTGAIEYVVQLDPDGADRSNDDDGNTANNYCVLNRGRATLIF